jgi:hypothetical protein
MGEFLLNNSKKILLISISILFMLFITSQTIYAFDDGFFWENASYSLDDGKVNSSLVRFEIFDTDLNLSGTIDTLSVIVKTKTSGGTPIQTLNLVLTEITDNGIFGIEHMLFMLENHEFGIGDTVVITIEDPCNEASDTNGNCDPLVIETLTAGHTVFVESDKSSGGFPITLIETGPNTSIFTRKLNFCTTPGCSSAVDAVLQVAPGSVFTVLDQNTNSLTNGLISGNSKRFSILVEQGGTIEVTATPTVGSTMTDSVSITAGIVGGRGSGGLVRPGLVVDSTSSSNDSSGGSTCIDCTPPTLGIDSNLNRIVKNGFSYNGNPVDVNLYYTPYPLIQTSIGKENKAILKVFEDTGAQNIEHIGLGFGLGMGESFSDSKATINLDRTMDGKEIVSTYDPDNVFDKVRVQSEIGSCDGSLQSQCMIFTIYHTFRSPLKFDMVATYVWDFTKNRWQNYYNHGIHIVGDSLNPPKTKSVGFGTNEMRGLFTLTQVDIYEDKWIDKFGNIYIHKGNDRFDKIYAIPKEIIYDTMTIHGCTRLCNWFESYKVTQEELAKDKMEKIFLGKKIIGQDKGFISSPSYNKVSRAENLELQNIISEEIIKATELFDRSFDVKNNF